ncbi:MAG: ABC transporter ATP-binding protein [Microbacteriaceae bacterium]|jgi:putative ABC transport system ATP-binding protein|nr:ABC transporter ATP-binding protein [Microbacteriaceae bacterium]
MSEQTVTIHPIHPVPTGGGAGERPAASAQHLIKQYGEGPTGVRALDDVNLEVAPGEFVAIMGPSGSGKSTLMHMMAGLDVPTSGRVTVGGADLTRMDDDALTRLRRGSIGFIFQSFNLVPTLNVRENVTLPFLLAGHRPTHEENARADRLIGQLGLGERVTHRPSQLSGGQQQRVAIARALVTEPVVIFADEPTGALDSRSSRDVLDLLSHASRSAGQSIVMVTHDATAASRADRVVVLSDGRIVQSLGHTTASEISDVMLALEARA